MPFSKLQHQQSQTYLFILPPELRDTIYRLALVRSTPISPQRKSHRDEERSVLPLMRSCQRVHNETAKIYFGGNVFRFFDDGELGSELSLFFRGLGHGELKLCTAVSLEASLGPRRDRLTLFCGARYCVGSVEIDLRESLVATSGRTSCCHREAEELTQAREAVQRLLKELDVGALGASQRAKLGSEVGIEFGKVFEHLHPDYGD